MTESQLNGPLRNYKLNYLNSSRSDAAEKNEVKQKQLLDGFWKYLSLVSIKLQLHDAIYQLQFYSNSLIHILSLSNLHNNIASVQKNRDDKLHRVIVALHGKRHDHDTKTKRL